MRFLPFVGASCVLFACSSIDVLGERPTAVSPGTGGGPDTGGTGGAPEAGGTGGASGGADASGGTQSEGGAPPDDPLEGILTPPNILKDHGVPITQVDAQVNEAFLKLFFGAEDERVYFDELDGTGYIKDIYNNEVRTDAMANGMLATVRLDQRDIFDKLWSWAKLNMMVQSGAEAGLLRWQCDVTGTTCTAATATDASSIIATTLIMAENRWGDAGAHDYLADAIATLAAMTQVEEKNGGIVDGIMNCFDLDAALPRPGTDGPADETPVDYLMPAFYELWARYDLERADLWRRMATNSRALLSIVSDPETGLMPTQVTYDGQAVPDLADYTFTTSRTLLNLALDQWWFGPQAWQQSQPEPLLDFFLAEGVDSYVSEYTTDGQPLISVNTAAHKSLVAVAAGTTGDPRYDVFLDRFLALPVPTGDLRYFNGMMYILSLLALSGQITPS